MANVFQLAGRLRSERHMRQLPRGVKEDIAAWRRFLRVWNGRQKWVPASPELVLCSDASVAGFGGWIVWASEPVRNCLLAVGLDVGAAFAGTWAPEHRERIASHEDIAWGELFAVDFGFRRLGGAVRNVAVGFLCDISGDVYSINHQRVKSKDPALRALMREFFEPLIQNNIRPVAGHIAGELNDVSDFLWRPERQSGGLSLERLRARYSDCYLTSLLCCDSAISLPKKL